MPGPRALRAPLLALAAAVLLAAPAARAQARPSAPDLPALALLWATGEYAEPVLCPLEEGPVRVARILRIRPERRSAHRRLDVVEVRPLEVDGVRCTDDLGRPEPEMEGELRLGMSGHARPDTARRDFESALRREGGFEFTITAGRLRVHDGDDDGVREVDLEGGTARLEQARRGSDAARLLGDVEGRPKRILTLEGPEGDRFVFHLVLLRPLR